LVIVSVLAILARRVSNQVEIAALQVTLGLLLRHR
jgi:hypothetical protein